MKKGTGLTARTMTDDPSPAPRLDVDVAVPCADWLAALATAEALCRTAAAAAFQEGGAFAPGPAEVSLVLADDATLQDLNRTYRNQDKPTNVLSFPGRQADEAAPPPGQPLLLGDVVIAFGTAAAEAGRDGKALADHLSHLVVHGMLHLLGHDHEATADAEKMEALERRILSGLGIGDPYADQPESR